MILDERVSIVPIGVLEQVSLPVEYSTPGKGLYSRVNRERLHTS
jgi:hypothetical protein